MEFKHFLASIAYEEVMMILAQALIMRRPTRHFYFPRFAGFYEPTQAAVNRRQAEAGHSLRGEFVDLWRRCGTDECDDRLPDRLLLMAPF